MKKGWWESEKIQLAGIVTGLMMGMPLLVYAQAQPTKTPGFLDYVAAGGWVGYLIILCSVGMVALIVEHIVNIKRDKLVPPDIVAELEALIEEGNYEDALTVCTATPTFFTNTIGAALAKVNDGYDEMVKAMDETGSEEALKLNQHISYLSLIGNIGPMMGLFGTVWGMVGAFTVIAQKESPSPAELATGVYTALITTVLGLLVAIPSLTAYFFFKNKVGRLIMEIGMICGEFIDKFRPRVEQPTS